MAYFKTKDNQVHYIDDPLVEAFRRGETLDVPVFQLLVEAVEITEQEAKDLTTPSPEERRQQEEAQKLSEKQAALNELDRQSIRALREYVAAQQNAPQKLKDLEASAIKARAS